jgi:hypothetical protein
VSPLMNHPVRKNSAALYTLVCEGAFRMSFFKFFLFLIAEFAHTSSSTHELHLFLLLPFICVTLTCPSPFAFINSVLPTKHLFGHHQP